MGLRSAQLAQIGYKIEATYGANVVVDSFMPLRSEKIRATTDKLVDPGIISGRRLPVQQQIVDGRKVFAGPVLHSLYNLGQDPLWLQAFGTMAQSGSAHTYTLGDTIDNSLTVQVGRPGTLGTVHPHTFVGGMFSSWELAFAEGEIPTFGYDLVAQDMYLGTALAAASYGTVFAAYSANQLAVTIGGTAVKVKKGSLKCNMGHDTDRRFVGSAKISQPLEADHRQFEFDLECEFEDMRYRTSYDSTLQHDVVLTFTASHANIPLADTIVLTAKTYLSDDPLPGVEGKGLLTQPLKLMVDAVTTDAAAITCVVTNAS